MSSGAFGQAIAEEAGKVDPDLVTCDEKGGVYSVRYEPVNAMLLNEFLKEHAKVEEERCKEQQLEATIERQRDEIAALARALKEQAGQIQRISPKLAGQNPAPLVLANTN